jgi:hypothetical protein
VDRLRGESRRRLRAKLAERPRGHVERGHEQLHRLTRVEALLRELANQRVRSEARKQKDQHKKRAAVAQRKAKRDGG